MRFLIFILFSFIFFISVQGASAHILKTNGSVGGVVHVSPDDDPIANQPTDFFFEFKDKDNKFKPQNCDCKVLILQSGKEVYNSPLFQNNTNPSLTNASFSYTFPQKDIYTVKIIGNPNQVNAFEPFVLTYDIRVERDINNQSATTTTQNVGIIGWISNHVLHIIGGVIVLIFIFFALSKQKNNTNVK